MRSEKDEIRRTMLTRELADVQRKVGNVEFLLAAAQLPSEEITLTLNVDDLLKRLAQSLLRKFELETALWELTQKG